MLCQSNCWPEYLWSAQKETRTHRFYWGRTRSTIQCHRHSSSWRCRMSAITGATLHCGQLDSGRRCASGSSRICLGLQRTWSAADGARVDDWISWWTLLRARSMSLAWRCTGTSCARSLNWFVHMCRSGVPFISKFETTRASKSPASTSEMLLPPPTSELSSSIISRTSGSHRISTLPPTGVQLASSVTPSRPLEMSLWLASTCPGTQAPTCIACILSNLPFIRITHVHPTSTGTGCSASALTSNAYSFTILARGRRTAPRTLPGQCVTTLILFPRMQQTQGTSTLAKEKPNRPTLTTKTTAASYSSPCGSWAWLTWIQIIFVVSCNAFWCPAWISLVFTCQTRISPLLSSLSRRRRRCYIFTSTSQCRLLLALPVRAMRLPIRQRQAHILLVICFILFLALALRLQGSKAQMFWHLPHKHL